MKQKHSKKIAASLLCLAVIAQNAAVMPVHFASAAQLAETVNSIDGKTDASSSVGSAVRLQSVIQRVFEYDFGSFKALYDTVTRKWYTKAGAPITSETVQVQEIALDGNESFRFDFEHDSVEEKNGDEWTATDRFDALLRNIKQFRPAYSEQFFDKASQSNKDVPEPENFPLTFVFEEKAAKPTCSVFFGSYPLGVISDSTYEAGSGGSDVTPVFEQEEGVQESADAVPFTGTGDVTLDGAKSISDAVLTSRTAAEDETTPISALGMELADKDGDGLVNIGDVQDLLYDITGTPVAKRQWVHKDSSSVLHQNARLLYSEDEQDVLAKQFFGKTSAALREEGSMHYAVTERDDAVTVDMLFFADAPMQRIALQKSGQDENGDLHITASIMKGEEDSTNSADAAYITLTLPRSYKVENVFLHKSFYSDVTTFRESLGTANLVEPVSTEIWQQPEVTRYDSANALLTTDVKVLHGNDEVEAYSKDIAGMSLEELYEEMCKPNENGWHSSTHQFVKVTQGEEDTVEFLFHISGGIPGIGGILDADVCKADLSVSGKLTVMTSMVTNLQNPESLSSFMYVKVILPHGLMNYEKTPELEWTSFYDISNPEEYARRQVPDEIWLNAEEVPGYYASAPLHAIEKYAYAQEAGLNYYAEQFGYRNFAELSNSADHGKAFGATVLGSVEQPMGDGDAVLTLGLVHYNKAYDDLTITGLEYDEKYNILKVKTAAYDDGQAPEHDTDMKQYLFRIQMKAGYLPEDVQIQQETTVYTDKAKFEKAAPETLKLEQVYEHYRQYSFVPFDAVEINMTENLHAVNADEAAELLGFDSESALREAMRKRDYHDHTAAPGLNALSRFKKGSEYDTLYVVVQHDDTFYSGETVTGIERLAVDGYYHTCLELRMLRSVQTRGCLAAGGEYSACTIRIPHGTVKDFGDVELNCENTLFEDELNRCAPSNFYLPADTVYTYEATAVNVEETDYSLEDLNDEMITYLTDELFPYWFPDDFMENGKNDYAYTLEEGEETDTLKLYFQLEGQHNACGLAVTGLNITEDGQIYVNAETFHAYEPKNEGVFCRGFSIPHGLLPDLAQLHVNLIQSDLGGAVVQSILADIRTTKEPSLEQKLQNGIALEYGDCRHWTYDSIITDEDDLAYLAELLDCENDQMVVNTALTGWDGKKGDWVDFKLEEGEENDKLRIVSFRKDARNYERLNSLHVDNNGVLHAHYDDYMGDGLLDNELDVCELLVPHGTLPELTGIEKEELFHRPVDDEFDNFGMSSPYNILTIGHGNYVIKDKQYAEFRGGKLAQADTDELLPLIALYNRIQGEEEEAADWYRELSDNGCPVYEYYVTEGAEYDTLRMLFIMPDGGKYDYRLNELNVVTHDLFPRFYRVEAEHPTEGDYVCAVTMSIPRGILSAEGYSFGVCIFDEHGYYRDPEFDASGIDRHDYLKLDSYYVTYLSKLEPVQVVLTAGDQEQEQELTYIPVEYVGSSKIWELSNDIDDSDDSKEMREYLAEIYDCGSDADSLNEEMQWGRDTWRVIPGEEQDTLQIFSCHEEMLTFERLNTMHLRNDWLYLYFDVYKTGNDNSAKALMQYDLLVPHGALDGLNGIFREDIEHYPARNEEEAKYGSYYYDPDYDEAKSSSGYYEYYFNSLEPVEVTLTTGGTLRQKEELYWQENAVQKRKLTYIPVLSVEKTRPHTLEEKETFAENFGNFSFSQISSDLNIYGDKGKCKAFVTRFDDHDILTLRYAHNQRATDMFDISALDYDPLTRTINVAFTDYPEGDSLDFCMFEWNIVLEHNALPDTFSVECVRNTVDSEAEYRAAIPDFPTMTINEMPNPECIPVDTVYGRCQLDALQEDVREWQATFNDSQLHYKFYDGSRTYTDDCGEYITTQIQSYLDDNKDVYEYYFFSPETGSFELGISDMYVQNGTLHLNLSSLRDAPDDGQYYAHCFYIAVPHGMSPFTGIDAQITQSFEMQDAEDWDTDMEFRSTKSDHFTLDCAE